MPACPAALPKYAEDPALLALDERMQKFHREFEEELHTLHTGVQLNVIDTTIGAATVAPPPTKRRCTGNRPFRAAAASLLPDVLQVEPVCPSTISLLVRQGLTIPTLTNSVAFQPKDAAMDILLEERKLKGHDPNGRKVVLPSKKKAFPPFERGKGRGRCGYASPMWEPCAGDKTVYDFSYAGNTLDDCICVWLGGEALLDNEKNVNRLVFTSKHDAYQHLYLCFICRVGQNEAPRTMVNTILESTSETPVELDGCICVPLTIPQQHSPARKKNGDKLGLTTSTGNYLYLIKEIHTNRVVLCFVHAGITKPDLPDTTRKTKSFYVQLVPGNQDIDTTHVPPLHYLDGTFPDDDNADVLEFSFGDDVPNVTAYNV